MNTQTVPRVYIFLLVLLCVCVCFLHVAMCVMWVLGVHEPEEGEELER